MKNLNQLKVGSVVRALPHVRHHAIHAGAEYTPGWKTNFKGGWTGTVTGIFEGMGPDDVYVGIEKEDGSYYELSVIELEILEEEKNG